MKIECDKCSAKYSIADEKVRGKTFKIRCKKCSNVIIVRDKGAAAGGGGLDAGAGDMGEAPGWHLAINGETVGPMGEDEVRQRYDAGEIDKETAVWQEGFEDWVPLGEVDAFAAFPDRAAAAADPFVSANQDDYAATGTGGAIAAGAASAAASARAGAGGGDRVRQGTSPRVSSLTGQRNENSVLFSLDSLQAIATSGGGAAAARAAAAPVAARASANPSKGLATSAPSSEGSGLIDIRALGAMVGSESVAPVATAAPNRAADDSALPSFGGAGFAGLSATPLVHHHAPVEAAAAAALAAQPQARSNAPLYIMMIILILAVLGLAGFILLRDQDPQTIVKEVPGAAPSVADGGDDKDKDKDKGGDDEDDEDDEDKDKDDEEKDDEGEKAAGESGGAEPEGDVKDDKTGAKKSSSSKSSSSKKSTSSTSSSSTSSSTSSSSTPTPPPKEEDIPVECIIDPKSCKSGKPKSSSTSSTSTTPKADPSLPETLSQADIKAGVAPHKDAAKSCGGKHGAPSGEKVTVKLSISGASGTVSSATATGKHAGTPLGNCVAAALKKATFKKFQKPSIGAQYPITL